MKAQDWPFRTFEHSHLNYSLWSIDNRKDGLLFCFLVRSEMPFNTKLLGMTNILIKYVIPGLMDLLGTEESLNYCYRLMVRKA